MYPPRVRCACPGYGSDALETCIGQRDLGTPRMRWDRLFAPLLEDQRLQALLTRIPTDS